MRAHIFKFPAIVVLGASTLAGCGSSESADSEFRPNFAVMAQCQDGKIVTVKTEGLGNKPIEPMTTSHTGASCGKLAELKPAGLPYVQAVLTANKDVTVFYPELRTSGQKAKDPMLPIQSGDYLVVLGQLSGAEGDKAVDPSKAETIGRNKLFKRLERAAIGRTGSPGSTNDNSDSGEERFWPTYSTLAQCQDGKMVHVKSVGKPPHNEASHKADPSSRGNSCENFGSLAKDSLVQVGRLDVNDDLAVSGIYKSDGVLYSPSNYALKSGEYLLALVQEPGKKGPRPIIASPKMAEAFNSHPLVEPLVKAAPPLKPAAKA